MARQLGDVMLGSIELFCLAAEQESFTAAAQVAGLSPAAVSRSVARLEERLQVRLFVRATRKIRLTDAGRAYLAQCRQALHQLHEAERELTGAQVEPAGRVRLSVSTTLGHHRVLPALPRFSERYPKVELELHVGNRNVDFAQEDYDLAIRARVPPDSGLVARRLLDEPLVTVAAPRYLAQARSALRTPGDLGAHQCIQFVLPSSGLQVPWVFRIDAKDTEVATPRSRYVCVEDVLAVSTLVRAGAGVAQVLRFTVEDDLRRGDLVEVLQAFAGPSRPFSLVYPGRRHLPLRVRALIDFLVQEVGQAQAAAPPTSDAVTRRPAGLDFAA